MIICKSLLRKQLRQARRALTPSQQKMAAAKLCWRLLRSSHFRASQYIAFYWPADGEISVLPFLKWATHQGKHCYLPIVHPHSLQFRHYRPGDRLYRNQFGIPEPGPGKPLRGLVELDAILVPLVGFDEKGNRLGMGAGYYDRAFAACGHFGPRLVGVAHELQKLESVPTDSWDIPLHQIVTDRRCYRTR